MTPEEIVKSLRACGRVCCDDCVCFQENVSCKKKDLGAADLIEQQAARIAELEAKVPRWIPVTERLPKPETEVLAVCNRNGYIFVVPAIYEDGKILTQDSMWHWNEIHEYGLYNEETDDYFIPESWWENRQFTPDDVYNNPVDCAVTHWMPLPEVAKEVE